MFWAIKTKITDNKSYIVLQDHSNREYQYITNIGGLAMASEQGVPHDLIDFNHLYEALGMLVKVFPDLIFDPVL